VNELISSQIAPLLDWSNKEKLSDSGATERETKTGRIFAYSAILEAGCFTKSNEAKGNEAKAQANSSESRHFHNGESDVSGESEQEALVKRAAKKMSEDLFEIYSADHQPYLQEPSARVALQLFRTLLGLNGNNAAIPFSENKFSSMFTFVTTELLSQIWFQRAATSDSVPQAVSSAHQYGILLSLQGDINQILRNKNHVLHSSVASAVENFRKSKGNALILGDFLTPGKKLNSVLFHLENQLKPSHSKENYPWALDAVFEMYEGGCTSTDKTNSDKTNSSKNMIVASSDFQKTSEFLMQAIDKAIITKGNNAADVSAATEKNNAEKENNNSGGNKKNKNKNGGGNADSNSNSERNMASMNALLTGFEVLRRIFGGVTFNLGNMSDAEVAQQNSQNNSQNNTQNNDADASNTPSSPFLHTKSSAHTLLKPLFSSELMNLFCYQLGNPKAKLHKQAHTLMPVIRVMAFENAEQKDVLGAWMG
jgi:hypothetical protein